MKTRTIMTNFMARAVMTLLVMTLTTSTAWAEEDDDVEINENTFPNEKFREWVLSQYFGEDGWLYYYEIEEVEEIDVSGWDISDLTGIEYFKNLKLLNCSDNQLTTLDLSRNYNLEEVYCEHNQLTTLYLGKSPALHELHCNFNRIRGRGMDALIASLPEREDGEGLIWIANLTYPEEQNAITTTQVALANAKGWDVHAGWNGNWYPYEGLPILTLVDNADNTSSIANAGDIEVAATLEGRTLYMDGAWNTLSLPFSVGNPDADEGHHFDGTPLEGFDVKELDIENEYEGHKTGFSQGTLYLNFRDANSIEAGVPYLVKKASADASSLTVLDTDGTGGFIGEGYNHLVDGKTEKKWCAESEDQVDDVWFCEFMTSAPVFVTGYTLTTGNDIENYNDRNPAVWSLQAKVNSADEWTVIDSRDAWENEEDVLPWENTETKGFDIASDLQGTYRYFRFEVADTEGSEIMELGELTLQGTVSYLESPTFYYIMVNAAEPTAVTSEDETVSFVGCYSPVTLLEGDRNMLYLGADNTLYYPSTDVTINSFRAYFQLNGITEGDLDGEVNAFVLNFGDDETTSIDQMTIDHETIEHSPLTIDHEAWYDLSGRKLNGKPTAKGIYINNGKKFVIK